jgi:hypothetical protein
MVWTEKICAPIMDDERIRIKKGQLSNGLAFCQTQLVIRIQLLWRNNCGIYNAPFCCTNLLYSHHGFVNNSLSGGTC